MAIHVELRVLNSQPGCVCFQYSLRHPVAMSLLRAALALCLLCLLAASLAEETAKTEQVDDDHGLEREARELNEDVDVEADSYEDVMSRQKRNVKNPFCGLCRPLWNLEAQTPCYRLRRLKYRQSYRCGLWRRRRTCYNFKSTPISKQLHSSFKSTPISKQLHSISKSTPINDRVRPSSPICRVPVGRQYVVFPVDHQNVVFPVGRQYVVFPVGRQYVVFPVGRQYVVFPVGRQYVVFPVGRQYVVFPVGRQNVVFPVGRQYVVFPVGRQYVVFPVGRQNVVFPVGRQYVVFPVGRQYVVFPVSCGPTCDI
ncbi:hypothetical protein LSAT2_000855 [Lamellibrachia satsuma]|nr:hypothetical protein LSAT2_000855 [Lamellibrachia satsuma]